MMKTQLKPAHEPQPQPHRDFSTIDLLLLIVLVGGIGSVFGAVLAQAFQDHRPMKAKMATEALARQIEARVAEKENATGTRLPSSVSSQNQNALSQIDLTEGKLGKDPWGRPFHYLVRDHQVVVWSDGLNGKSESDLAPKFALGGDDIASVRRLRSAHP